MNPGSFTDRHTPTRPTMPAARGEESERARERCTCIYNKVKRYWGPTNERTVPLYGVVVCNTTSQFYIELIEICYTDWDTSTRKI